MTGDAEMMPKPDDGPNDDEQVSPLIRGRRITGKQQPGQASQEPARASRPRSRSPAERSTRDERQGPENQEPKPLEPRRRGDDRSRSEIRRGRPVASQPSLDLEPLNFFEDAGVVFPEEEMRVLEG